jgi:flagellar motility protein MotE (MotC chaperone)
MTLHLPAPRALPFTIAVIAALLAVKATDLARLAAIAFRTAPAEVVAAAHAAAPAKLPPPPPPTLPSSRHTGSPLISDAERKVLTDLRQRRKQLDGRAAALSVRESMLAAAEQKLNARVAELQALQTKLETLQTARKQRQEQGWIGLVKLYEDMKPRDAATIFNDLEMPVLLALVDRMDERKAAMILAAMNPEKAREVTARLARLRTHSESAGATLQTGG